MLDMLNMARAPSQEALLGKMTQADSCFWVGMTSLPGRGGGEEVSMIAVNVMVHGLMVLPKLVREGKVSK